MGKLIEGVRVIALTQAWAGPWALALLADMGAEVIRVESQRKPGTEHKQSPATASADASDAGDESEVSQSIPLRSLYRGMKSCTIDLKQPEGVENFKKLVKISDVVLENNAPRVMPSLGLDYAALKEVKPDIIMVSMPGFGTTGPDKDYVSYASTVGAVGGLIASFGYPGEEPAQPGVHPGDPVGGAYGALVVLAALSYRQRTGKGQYLDVAQTEALPTLIPEVIMEYVMNGRFRPTMGNRDEIMAPHQCYKCKGEDNWVAIAVGTDEEWSALCRAMGNPDWSKEQRFSDQYSRWQNQEELDKLITEWTKNFAHYEVMQKLQEVGVAAGPSLNMEELVNDPQIKERGVFIEQDHSVAGKVIVFRSPWKSALTETLPPVPYLGEHNSYVFKELLGMPDEEFDRLISEKVIH